MSTVRRRREVGCTRVGGGLWSASPWREHSACCWPRRQRDKTGGHIRGGIGVPQISAGKRKLWSGVEALAHAERRHAGDGFQRPLRARFRQRLMPSVRRFGGRAYGLRTRSIVENTPT